MIGLVVLLLLVVGFMAKGLAEVNAELAKSQADLLACETALSAAEAKPAPEADLTAQVDAIAALDSRIQVVTTRLTALASK